MWIIYWFLIQNVEVADDARGRAELKCESEKNESGDEKRAQIRAEQKEDPPETIKDAETEERSAAFTRPKHKQSKNRESFVFKLERKARPGSHWKERSFIEAPECAW